MNKVVLIGRLTRDPELRHTQSNLPVCQLSIAVDRKFKSDGQPTADFINCVAWRHNAEFISKYFVKGQRIAVAGSIQTSTWDDKEGNKRYSTEVIIDEAEFADSKRSDAPTGGGGESNSSFGNDNSQPQQGGFFVLDEDDGDIPF